MNNRLEQLLELHREDPQDTFTRYAIALEYNARQDFEQAKNWFERLRADEPDYVPTYYMLAGVYRASDEPDKAKEIYQAGLRTAKKMGDTHAFAELSAALEELEEEEI
ncbi:MAG: tetratricopeptide repeat protein [Ignavibacteria bacterium]|nr:tetratricopeptide repeat protein [Ignavibacteria bacterium]MBL7991600.1 tetratricopeptide repeat protein [Candidatus Kapabacteria bacterium]